MTWWREPRSEGCSLAWSVLWPAAWLWEWAAGWVRQAAEDVRAWWLISDDDTFVLGPAAGRFLEEARRR